MPLYTVDDTGQLIVTPSELDEFEYYRDNILVRKFQETMDFKYSEIIEAAGPDYSSWTNVTDNLYWESADTDLIEWTGSVWQVKSGIPSTPTTYLNAIGPWVTDYRPKWCLVTCDYLYNLYDVDVRIHDTNGNEDVISQGYFNFSGEIYDTYLNYYGYDISFLEIRMASGVIYPFNITGIYFGDDEVFGSPIIMDVTENWGDFDYNNQQIELDSNSKIHWLGFKDNGVIYKTNKTGEIVTESNSVEMEEPVGMIIKNNIPEIAAKEYSGGGIYYPYHWYNLQNSSWSSLQIQNIYIGFASEPNFLVKDSNNYLYALTIGKIWNQFVFSYKTTGSWTNDTPDYEHGGENIQHKGMVILSNDDIYCFFTVSSIHYMIKRTAAGSWGTREVISIPADGHLRVDENDNIYSIRYSSSKWDIYKRDFATGVWSFIVTASPDPMYGEGPDYSAISVTAGGTVRIWYSPLIYKNNGDYDYHLTRLLTVRGIVTTDELVQVNTWGYVYANRLMNDNSVCCVWRKNDDRVMLHQLNGD